MTKNSIPIKQIAVQAGITALAFAVVNRWFSPKSKGYGYALKTLAFLPLEVQAKFADVVTVQNARNEKWLIEQMSNQQPDNLELYKNLNQTSIGNLAYVAIHGVVPEIRQKALKILENIKTISIQ